MTKGGDKLDFRYVNGTPVKPNDVVTLGRHGDIRWSGSLMRSLVNMPIIMSTSGNALFRCQFDERHLGKW
ncbi:MAG: hypothetical protein R3D26_12080 [Cyanobacteriota/Melainabacteria group bacterium]